MGKLIKKRENREYVSLKPNSMILPRRDVYTYIRNGIAISIPDVGLDVEDRIRAYVVENLSKFGWSEFAIQEIQHREQKKQLTKFFVIFTTDDIAEKLLKSHTRTYKGKRINVQPAIVSPVKKTVSYFLCTQNKKMIGSN